MIPPSRPSPESDPGHRGTGCHRRLGALLLLAGGIGAAQAVGLGEMTLHSRLGEPLRAEVPLIALPEGGVEATCFSLVSQPHGTDDVPWLGHARFAVAGGPRPVVKVSTGEAVQHPVLMLGIRLACGFEVTREYTLLLEPAAVKLPAAEPAGHPAGPPAAPRSAVAVGQTWEAIEGETLAAIAAQLHPRSRRAQRRFVAAAVRANPELFDDPALAANVPLAGGTLLQIPDLRPPAPPPPEEAAPRERPRRRLPAPQPPRETAGRQDRLSLSGDIDLVPAAETGLRLSGSLDLGRGPPLSETQRELLRQERRLLAALEDQIVQQLTLADKIRRMEDALSGLRGGLGEVDRRIQAVAEAPPAVAPAAEPPAPQPPPPPEAQPGADATWRDGLLLGLLAAGVVAVLLVLRARSRRAETAEEEPPPEDAPTQPPAPARMLEVDLPLDDAAPLPPPRQMPQRETMAGASPAIPDEHAIDVAEHESAMELAEIMLSFGRVQGAAQTLADYLEANPRQAVQPWIKLLDIYRGAGMQAEFDTLARRLNQTFNIELLTWEGRQHDQYAEELEGYPHLIQRIEACWGKDDCLEYLHHLLRDNRNGTRSGFPVAVLYEIMLLIGVLEEHAEAQGAPPAST